MLMKIEVSTYKSYSLKALAVVETVDSHKRSLQWPAKRHQNNTGHRYQFRVIPK